MLVLFSIPHINSSFQGKNVKEYILLGLYSETDNIIWS